MKDVGKRYQISRIVPMAMLFVCTCSTLLVGYQQSSLFIPVDIDKDHRSGKCNMLYERGHIV